MGSSSKVVSVWGAQKRGGSLETAEVGRRAGIAAGRGVFTLPVAKSQISGQPGGSSKENDDRQFQPTRAETTEDHGLGPLAARARTRHGWRLTKG